MTIIPDILIIALPSFTVSALLAFLVYMYGHKISLIDTPNNRSSHSTPTPRGGGIGIWMVYTGIGFYSSQDYTLILTTSSMGLLGLIEDCFKLSSKLRLTMQTILAIMAIYKYDISYMTIILIFFIVGTTNFYNFMDGINGIAGLSGVVSFGLTAYFSYYHLNEPVIAVISISLSSACLGFLVLNLPNGKVFMGDIGSLLLGFSLALFIIKLSLNIEIFICLIMFLCTFYADALVTVFYRWKNCENLMQAHRKHLYQYLSNELGLAHWKVSVIYTGIHLVFGASALFAYTKGIVWQITVVFVFSLMFLVCYKYIKNLQPRFVSTAHD
ncbi:glycosyl transferase family protein [Candidatus Magnetobacterium bavaricum]|uniref:Glycosyl transferase family protein n=1 Tax=Candidatus Magnetobacterium bavaricum TaxID=29290 RepID=A0A0F3GJT2_9BACT|nr:glycosyl transferase family protein [Candidatus Magnetobacterium bavaricum]